VTALRALFADLLPGGERNASVATGESGESGESQGQACAAAESAHSESLAKSGERRSEAAGDSPVFATHSPMSNRAQREQRRGLSPDSPNSPRAAADNDSPPRPHRLSKAEADRCHRPAWSEAEIAAFVARVALFLRRGMPAADADDLAERLTLRDRNGDDRGMCVECRFLERSGGCAEARAGRLYGFDRRYEPLRTVLQRCESFEPVRRCEGFDDAKG
jgi:hypothetical protein